MGNDTNKGVVLAELRSGLYKQDRGYLRTDGDEGPPAFCALGVVCEAYRKHSGNDDHEWRPVKDSYDTSDVTEGRVPLHFVYTADDGKHQPMSDLVPTVILPPLVAEWAFGDSYAQNPMVTHPNRLFVDRLNVSILNDEGLMSFGEIADVLEANAWGEE